jgi:hypothetical protein
MINDIQPTKIRLPKWASVFVFGSVLQSQHPGDLDLLVVYNQTLCPAKQARLKAEKLVLSLANSINLRRHVVVLSEPEEQSVDFIKRQGCVTFSEWLTSPPLPSKPF